MTGMFELFIDARSRFRFRVVAPDGTVMAVSKGFDDKPAAVAGIGEVREYAGMGLITDLCLLTDRCWPSGPERGGAPVSPGCVEATVPPSPKPGREALPVRRRGRKSPTVSA